MIATIGRPGRRLQGRVYQTVIRESRKRQHHRSWNARTFPWQKPHARSVPKREVLAIPRHRRCIQLQQPQDDQVRPPGPVLPWR